VTIVARQAISPQTALNLKTLNAAPTIGRNVSRR
jgi:hypothetical protein